MVFALADSATRGAAPCYLHCELQARKFGVKAALGDELLVRPLGDDAAVIEHYDPVGAKHGRQTMRNRDGCASACQSL